MQTTLRIDDEIYREAKAEAAREGITLTKFIEEALRLRLERVAAKPDEMSELPTSSDSVQAYHGNEVRRDFSRAALIKRLEGLFEQADERDRLKKGSAGPFSREELYAERLDRFR
jgi:antitoxin component of RelBE/YafQ-DinJ toxin-antitoxin module